MAGRMQSRGFKQSAKKATKIQRGGGPGHAETRVTVLRVNCAEDAPELCTSGSQRNSDRPAAEKSDDPVAKGCGGTLN